MATPKLRLYRIEIIRALIRKCEDGANMKKLAVECCLKWGTARRTILEYMDDLIVSKEFLKKDGIIYYNDNTEKQNQGDVETNIPKE